MNNYQVEIASDVIKEIKTMEELDNLKNLVRELENVSLSQALSTHPLFKEVDNTRELSIDFEVSYGTNLYGHSNVIYINLY